MKKITSTLEETQSYGEEMGKKALPGEVYLLFGELGAGKTSFVQGFAKGLGVRKRIMSPTFVIMRSYSLGKGKSFNHVDLYRLNKGDIEGVGVKDAVNDSSSITAIEWAERLDKENFNNGYKIYFSYHNLDGAREIKVERING